MPRRTFPTGAAALSAPFGPNGAVMVGEQLLVKPLLPTTRDETARANAFRNLNADKSFLVNQWLAVRTGQAPVGDLMFKPPVGYDYPAGQHDATKEPNPPLQAYKEELDRTWRPDTGPASAAYDWLTRGVKESRDILTTNIWSRAGSTLRPIAFHIRGGGGGVSHARAPQQSGHRLAAHMDLMVVVPEYANSTYGHFPHPDLLVAGHPSIAYDQIKMQLKWVADYGGSFGGDVARCRVSSTSFGAALAQMLLADPEVQGWFKGALVGSGGGAPYVDALSGAYGEGYTLRTKTFEVAIRACASGLFSLHPDYVTVQDALDDGRSFAWVMQNVIRDEYIQALADARPQFEPASLIAAIRGTGTLEIASAKTEVDNVYPFKTGPYASAIDAAKAGAFQHPVFMLSAGDEARNLFGSDNQSLADGLRAMSQKTLDYLARRVGYPNYAGWLGAAWQPDGGLWTLSSAIFHSGLGEAYADIENRRILYAHAIFNFPAWRVARAIADTDSADVWLTIHNNSPNGDGCGHSTEVQAMFGNSEWLVGGLVGEGDEADVNLRMDAIYHTELMMRLYARFIATGDPNGTYEPVTFDLFSDPATHPKDAGVFDGTVVKYSLAQSYLMTVLGKVADETDKMNNLNGGKYTDGVLDLDSDQFVQAQAFQYHRPAFEDYFARLG